MRTFGNHKETIFVGLIGFLFVAALNVLFVSQAPDIWTNAKAGFWSAFWQKYEVSGFDPFTYIILSNWRPLYDMARHPLLAVMVWPLSQINEWLKEETGMNCAIYIVAVVWTVISTCSWVLMYKILRRIIEMTWQESLLINCLFFSFSHVLLTTFVEDHMTLTLFMLLLTIYLAGKSIKKGKAMPLWQSIPLFFGATGVTTTNLVKVYLADFITQIGRKPFVSIVMRSFAFLVPLAVIAGLYFYQVSTTVVEEKKSNQELMEKKASRNPAFAKQWAEERERKEKVMAQQVFKMPGVTSTEYHIDRWPSLQENVFGEGLILHEDYLLQDANVDRPVLVRYNHWWYYALEAMIVLLFVAGVWCGRRERLMWITLSMFVFDMILHVGFNFASADVYIMTAHWAFVIPVAIAYLLKRTASGKWLDIVSVSAVLFLTIFLAVHNIRLIYQYIV